MNRIFQYLLIFFIIFICSAWSPDFRFVEEVILPIHELNRDSKMPVEQISNEKYFSGESSLLFQPQSKSDYIILKDNSTALDFADLNYLILEVFCDTEFSVVMNIDFFRNNSDEPQISARIGVNPQLYTQVIFPLSYLDGQEIFMDRFPRQLKGTVLGRRMLLEEIDQIKVRIGPVQDGLYQPKFIVKSAYLSEDTPTPYEPLTAPIIDKLGQWKTKNWPGKISSEQEMIQQVKTLEKDISNAAFPEEWSRFGGDKSRKLSGKGFFRVQQQEGKWWFVDPDGYAFLSTGVDVMNPASPGPYEGIEDLFEWLPEEEGDFSDAVSNRQEQRQVSFLTANLIRVYGENWRKMWELLSANLMKTWRFNTIANWSDSSFISNQRLPYVLPLSNFPATEVSVFRDFPDVFDPSYREAAARFALQLEPYRNDSLMIGYFLRNEPHWGFGSHNLAFEMFSSDQDTYTKSRAVNWLSTKYNGNISKLNEMWGSGYNNFEAIGKTAIDQLDLQEQAEKDLWEFSGLMVDEYVKVVSEEVKKVDPNHLNLGMRFASISTDLFYRTGKFVDVFSLNQYSSPDPPPTGEIYKRTGKPVIIGEFHHGATDRGLPASGIQAAKDQVQRAVALRHYLEQGFARPEVIGMHYFQWNDQPWTGRYDGENYQIGVMDVTFQPYKHWTEAATKTNERLYKVASGKLPPFHQIIEEIPPIYY